eukprot:SAG11_NODE_25569_length_357_cov_0.596899_2_plen_39_part_01
MQNYGKIAAASQAYPTTAGSRGAPSQYASFQDPGAQPTL